MRRRILKLPGTEDKLASSGQTSPRADAGFFQAVHLVSTKRHWLLFCRRGCTSVYLGKVLVGDSYCTNDETFTPTTVQILKVMLSIDVQLIDYQRYTLLGNNKLNDYETFIQKCTYYTVSPVARRRNSKMKMEDFSLNTGPAIITWEPIRQESPSGTD